MATRDSMAALIARVRLMVGDSASATQALTDQQIQDTLDRARTDVRYELLRPQLTLSATAYQYLDYYSQYGDWESDAVLLGPGYAVLTPSTADYIVGHWTFPAGGGSGQYPPVLLAGKTYDLNRAAADLCEYRAAFGAGDFAFTADGASFHPEQAYQQWTARADYFRRKQRPMVVRKVRSDVAAGGDEDREALLGPVSADVPFITGE